MPRTRSISSFVDKGLRAAGFTTIVAASGDDALSFALSGSVDLVLLDIGLPGIDGFEVLRRLREVDTALPVIMLTARTSVTDTVAGLGGGANDYVPKPFKFDELLARVRLRLKDATERTTTSLELGDLGLDLRTRRATVNGRSIDLSAREFALAEEFLRHPHQVLSASSCSAGCGASTSIRGRTLSTSTCATCARSSAPSASRRCAAWDTDCADWRQSLEKRPNAEQRGPPRRRPRWVVGA